MLLSIRSNDSWRRTTDDVQQERKAADLQKVEPSDEENNGVSVPSSATWEEEKVCLNEKVHTNTFRIFGGEEKVPMYVLKALFGELLAILGKKDNSVDFTYLNGKKG